MPARSYQELKVWQSGVSLAKQCYFATKKFPPEELFGMTNQIRRAAGSIPANIAEGQGRRHRKAFLNHLSIARGSLNELETHLILSEQVGLMDSTTLEPLMRTADEIGRMLNGLCRSLKEGG